MRRLDLTKRARKFLDTLPPKQFRQVVRKIFDLLKDPEPHDSSPLKGHNYLRADVGEYRIIYRFDTDTVWIAVVGKRNDSEVYRALRGL
jgi:mRNA interferase RelE/StbE